MYEAGSNLIKAPSLQGPRASVLLSVPARSTREPPPPPPSVRPRERRHGAGAVLETACRHPAGPVVPLHSANPRERRHEVPLVSLGLGGRQHRHARPVRPHKLHREPNLVVHRVLPANGHPLELHPQRHLVHLPRSNGVGLELSGVRPPPRGARGLLGRDQEGALLEDGGDELPHPPHLQHVGPREGDHHLGELLGPPRERLGLCLPDLAQDVRVVGGRRACVHGRAVRLPLLLHGAVLVIDLGHKLQEDFGDAGKKLHDGLEDSACRAELGEHLAAVHLLRPEELVLLPDGAPPCHQVGELLGPPDLPALLLLEDKGPPEIAGEVLGHDVGHPIAVPLLEISNPSG
mmetsp:Transcript_14064/g.44748  ORF Transcript_14064/g.44748 Transcript_14064/m.44748 type:complete len:347 (-) Transcript_14064:393-1433(-)